MFPQWIEECVTQIGNDYGIPVIIAKRHYTLLLIRESVGKNQM